jgi:non-ribosomal peptide synthetase component F
VHRFVLPEGVVQGVRNLARQEGTSLFNLMLATFQVWLYRYTHQPDIVVGTPVSNRDRSEFHHTLGFFLNTLPIRVTLSGQQGFREAQKQVRQAVLGGLDHADLPFEEIVQLVGADRAGGSSPLYKAMFVWVEETIAPWRLGDARAQRMATGTGTARCDLTVRVAAENGTWACEWESAADQFSPAAAQRMSQHWVELLRSIVANPDEPLSRLSLLPARERQQLLVEWNDTKADYPRDTCVHELFEAQVERTPDARAVDCAGTALTYCELNSRANQLAHHLRELGVGPEGLVGLCVQRSVEMEIGLWGILKAGGAYVSLDPSQPQQRLTHMLEDAAPSVVVTHSCHADRLAKVTHARLVCLDSDVPVLSAQPAANPETRTAPNNLAYVLFTSGSTGRPK